MLTFISCAKTMATRCTMRVPELTVPAFMDEALRSALELSHYTASELEGLLQVNAKIAAENCLRYRDFCSEHNRPMPALCAYTGAVFKRIHPADFTAEDFGFAQMQAGKMREECLCFLQSEWSVSSSLLSAIIDYVLAHPRWKLSLQTHKFLNVR